MRAYDLICVKDIKLYCFDLMRGCEIHQRLFKHNPRDVKAKGLNFDEWSFFIRKWIFILIHESVLPQTCIFLPHQSFSSWQHAHYFCVQLIDGRSISQIFSIFCFLKTLWISWLTFRLSLGFMKGRSLCFQE